ncbi:unnamed protein product, partial [Iphiclides podalirius]
MASVYLSSLYLPTFLAPHFRRKRASPPQIGGDGVSQGAGTPRDAAFPELPKRRSDFHTRSRYLVHFRHGLEFSSDVREPRGLELQPLLIQHLITTNKSKRKGERASSHVKQRNKRRLSQARFTRIGGRIASHSWCRKWCLVSCGKLIRSRRFLYRNRAPARFLGPSRHFPCLTQP